MSDARNRTQPTRTSVITSLDDPFAQLIQLRLTELNACSPLSERQNILIAEPDPMLFLASLMVAQSVKANIWLINPTWGSREWQQVRQMVQADVIWGTPPDWTREPESDQVSLALPDSDTNLVMIPTGGSSGELRFAVHTWETLTAAVEGFRAHFQLQTVNTCCVLPVYHVSGLMQFLRSHLTGGQFVPYTCRDIAAGILPDFDPKTYWISLVPTQLKRLLEANQQDWLAQFQGVLLGGAPAWPSLLDASRKARIPIALTYGMTETAAQIATLHPQNFLQGNDSCGHLLPHAQLQIVSSEDCDTQFGQLQIQAKSLALGYATPQGFQPMNPEGLLTDDLGYLDAEGYLHIAGRASRKLISGGENVFPAEVEAAIQGTGLVQAVCVLGLPDPDWGQAVTAVYVPGSEMVTVEQLKGAIANQLCRYKQPKHWIAVEALPYNAQGKINVAELECAIAPLLAKD